MTVESLSAINVSPTYALAINDLSMRRDFVNGAASSNIPGSHGDMLSRTALSATPVGSSLEVAMADNKTTANDRDPREFIAEIDDERRRAEAQTLLALFEERTGEKPVMWGPSIIGFGSYDYTYESGRSGTWMRTGFSPRKQQMTLYVMPGFDEYVERLEELGPHTTGKSCLYVKRLDKVDLDVLGDIIATSYAAMANDDA